MGYFFSVGAAVCNKHVEKWQKFIATTSADVNKMKWHLPA